LKLFILKGYIIHFVIISLVFISHISYSQLSVVQSKDSVSTINSFAINETSKLASNIIRTPITKRQRFKDKYLGFLTDTIDKPDQHKLLIFPTFGTSPETSLEFGLSALKLFYINKDTNNRLSEIQTSAFVSLNKQYGGLIEHFIYSNKDRYFFLGKFRIQQFPLQYYGIGSATKKEDVVILNAKYLTFKEKVLRKVKPNFFAGLEVDCQSVMDVALGFGMAPPTGSNGSNSLGFGFGLVYDNRKNTLNVRDGKFAEVFYLDYSKKIKSDFQFNSLMMDFRYFKSVKKNQVFATQFVAQLVSDNAPFNMQAQIGGNVIMRGYYYGRFRDRQLFASQAEYRFLPFGCSNRIGGVAYFAAGTVQNRVNDFDFNNILPSGGLGFRYKLFAKKDIFIRLDAAATKEGLAFYIANGESF
jgi:hypothetical protein